LATGPLLNRELPDEVSLLKELFRYYNGHVNCNRSVIINPDEYFPVTINSFKQLRTHQQLNNMKYESGDTQEDSMEFLTFLLDQYHETLLKLKPEIDDNITGTQTIFQI
jgi:uncharacterized UBP type Zn finger protein